MTMVYIPAPLRDMCGGIATLDVQAPTLDALLRALDLRCPGFYARVVEDGRVRPELAVAIDRHDPHDEVRPGVPGRPSPATPRWRSP